MRQRASELEAIIRNSKIDRIIFEYECYSENIHKGNAVKFVFQKFEEEYFELTLYEPILIDMFDDNFHQNDIESVKIIQKERSIVFCFDPYDENNDEVEEKDNFVFEAREFRIVKKLPSVCHK